MYITKIKCDKPGCENVKDTAHGVVPEDWKQSSTSKHLCKTCATKLTELENKQSAQMRDFWS